MDSSKKTTIKLPTFQTWNLPYFVCKGELKKGVAYIYQVWCMICESNKGTLYQYHADKNSCRKFHWWNRLCHKTFATDIWFWWALFLIRTKRNYLVFNVEKRIIFEYTIWFYKDKRFKNIRTLFGQIFSDKDSLRLPRPFSIGTFWNLCFKILWFMIYNVGQRFCKLFHVLFQLIFTTKETEVDHYHLKVNVRVASRAAKQQKT